MFIYKTTQANHGSEFEWLGLEPNDYEPSEYRTCSVFEPLLYLQNSQTVAYIQSGRRVLLFGPVIYPS